MGKSIFRASSLTAPLPLPPCQGCEAFGVGFFFYPARLDAPGYVPTLKWGEGGAQLLKKYFLVIFSHPWTPEKTNLCIIAGRVSIQVVPITAAFVLLAMIVFGAPLTQPPEPASLNRWAPQGAHVLDNGHLYTQQYHF